MNPPPAPTKERPTEISDTVDLFKAIDPDLAASISMLNDGYDHCFKTELQLRALRLEKVRPIGEYPLEVQSARLAVLESDNFQSTVGAYHHLIQVLGADLPSNLLSLNDVFQPYLKKHDYAA